MFSFPFSTSETDRAIQKHAQWTPYKQAAPDTVMWINSQFWVMRGNACSYRLGETCCEDTERSLFLADLTANQLAGIIVILNDIDVTALPRITLNNRKLAVPEFFDFLGLAIEVVIVDLADQIPMRVHLHKIGLSVEIPIAFNLDHLVVFVGFDDIRPAISVCIDGNLVAVLVDPVYPLVRMSVATTMRDRTVGLAATGNEAESQRHPENRALAHVFL